MGHLILLVAAEGVQQIRLVEEAGHQIQMVELEVRVVRTLRLMVLGE